MNFKKILTAQIFLIGFFCSASEDKFQLPQDLAKWDLICFCSARYFTPHPIIKMGNNGEILFHARHGITRSRLKEKGILFSERQLKVLDGCGLLDTAGKILHTSFPVLGPSELQKMRDKLKNEAFNNGSKIKEEMQDLVSILNRQGYSENAYSIVFSYLLDGLVWEQFKIQKLMPVHSITPEKPFWDGTFYAVYPSRAKKPGTNTNTSNKWSISLTWTDPIIEASSSSGFSTCIEKLLSEIQDNGNLADSASFSELLKYQLINENRTLNIPIIQEKTGDPIYDQASKISKQVASDMLKIARRSDFRKLLGATDEARSLVIGYHEYMWELLDYLEGEKIISIPLALSERESIKFSDLHKLVYLIEKSK